MRCAGTLIETKNVISTGHYSEVGANLQFPVLEIFSWLIVFCEPERLGNEEKLALAFLRIAKAIILAAAFRSITTGGKPCQARCRFLDFANEC